MSDQSAKSDLEYSRQLQEKFELYLLALIFTLVGLAVQTAKFGASQTADILEFLGWVLLLISGLVGLSRFEWLPVAYKTNSHLVDLNNEHRQLMAASKQGHTEIAVLDQAEPANIETIIDDRAQAIQKVEVRVKGLEKSILRKYSVHKWLFVLGLALLIGARGYPPLVTMIDQHLATPSSGPAKAALSPAAEVKR